MADAEATTDAPASEAKKKLPIKTIGMIAIALVLEAGVVVFVMSKVGSPKRVEAQGLSLETDELEQSHELLIVNDRFPNNQTGRVWLWDLELQIKVKNRNLEYAEKILEERSAEIKTGVSQIMRTAHHNHLQEPNLETITRQHLAYLREVFGQDGNGEERVQTVLLPKCVGFPTD